MGDSLASPRHGGRGPHPAAPPFTFTREAHVMRRLTLLLALLPAMAHAQTTDKVLQRIRGSKTVTIAYRTDAPPFSSEEDGKPVGYSVEVCKRVVASLEQQLKVEPLAVKWVPANVQNRLDLVKKGEVDMECGTTTATLSRMEQVDFSSPVWVDVTGVIVRKSVGATALGGLAGKNIAVVAGTPNQRALEEALKKGLVNAKVVPAKSYDEAIALLEGGKADALAAGRTMLMGMGSKLKNVADYDLMNEDIGYVPYAIVLPLGANGLRTSVNRALSNIYDSDAIVEIFRGTFGPKAKPSPALVIMYQLNVYPE
jgi:ABC-type amino acid transport substrate-binding protein